MENQPETYLSQSENWYDNIQGNILKPHGRNHHALIFIQFDKETQKLKKWFTSTSITSFSQQLSETGEYKLQSVDDISFYGLYLTFSGYVKLGFLEHQIPENLAFRSGFKQSKNKLNESDIENWEEIYKEDIHAAYLVANDSKEKLDQEVNQLITEVNEVATSLGVEYGITLRDDEGFAREPFGFRDGISNPKFLPSKIKEHNTNQNNGFDISAQKEIVLVDDKIINGGFGSYVAINKLQQNVELFRATEKSIAQELSSNNPNIIGTQIVGRSRDGKPAHMAAPVNLLANDWDFLQDPEGAKCPFHSHIRKINDRGESLKLGKPYGEERTKRIVRRGFTFFKNYDEALKFNGLTNEAYESLSFIPKAAVGTMFIAFQSDIDNQFERLIRENMNNEDYFVSHTGKDALTSSKNDGKHSYTLKSGQNETQSLLDDFISLKGGEYFYAPPISFLKNIDIITVKEENHRTGSPSSQRTEKLRSILIEQGFTNRKDEWFTKGMLPNILELNPQYKNEPIIVRKALASEKMLEAMSDPINSVKTKTFEIEKDTLLLGILPMGSVGLGKTFPGYLTEEEARASSIVNRDEPSVFGHTVPNFKVVLENGLEHFINDANKRCSDNKYSEKQQQFYQAVAISSTAILAYCEKFAKLADEASQKTKDAKRKRELTDLATISRNVPRKPAQNFHEALQSVWIMHLAQTAFCSFNSLGRLDQVLAPYYEDDLKEGTIDEQFGLELIECFLLKCAHRIVLNPATLNDQDNLSFGTGIGTRPIYLDQIASCNNFIQNIVIGGVDNKGKDAVNPVTYLFLKAVGGIGLPTPTLNARVGKVSSKSYLSAIDQSIRNAGNGHPIIFNEDNIIEGLVNDGLEKKVARDFALAGCWEPMTHGMNSFTFGMVNAIPVLECALNEGKLLSSDIQFLKGQKQSWQTPKRTDIDTFDQLFKIFEKHMQFFADKVYLGNCSFFQFPNSMTPTPFVSLLLDGCYERGIDQTQGGAKYNIISNIAFGIPNVINALANIKKFVFEEKRWSLDEVAQALKMNWGISNSRDPYDSVDLNDEEIKQKFYEMRRCLIESQMKFGNGIPEVDLIAQRVLDIWYQSCKKASKLAIKAYLTDSEESRKLRLMTNYPAENLKKTLHKDFDLTFTIGSGTFGQYSSMGKGVNASADGRAANEPVAANCSPIAGTALNGLQGLFSSLQSLGLNRFGGAVVTDIRINGVKEPAYYFSNLIEEWAKHGGSMLTISVLPTSEVLFMLRLTDFVKNNPSQINLLKPYADRFCRVGGWNSPFICLPRTQQWDHFLRATFN